MAAAPNAKQLKIEATRVGNRSFISCAVAFNLRSAARRAIGNVPVSAVDVIKQLLPHEAVITLRRVGSYRHVFIEIEACDTGKIETFLAVQANQFLVNAN